jgi:four helix bundle protein
MLCALAAASTIADGYGRYTAPEQRQLYRSAKRELLRLETQLAIARQADLISAQTHADLGNRVQSVGRLLGGYLVYLERQLTPEPVANGKN